MGRSAEKAEVDRLLDAAGQGTGGRLLVLGDPGMGTTALLGEFAARARRRGAEVVLLPVADLAVADLPDATASDRTTVLIVDDLDIADAAAAGRLADLAVTPPAGWLILAGGRSTAHLPPAFTAWPQLRLEPLDLDDSVAILTDVLGSATPPTVLYRLATRLEGNPRALREVPALLTPDERQGRAPLREHLPVPASLDEAWGRLLEGLPDPARSAAVDLAVVGPRPDLLGAMSKAGHWDGADLDRLVDAGLVRGASADAPAFVHAVVRDVVLARTPTAEVHDRHRRAALLGEQLSLPPRLIVTHLEQSVSTVDEEVASALERQARRAEALDQVTVASQAWQASARMSTTESARVARALTGLRLVITNGLDYAGTDDLLDLLAGAQLDSECCLWVEWLHTLKAVETDPDAGLAEQFTTIRRARTAAPDTLRGLIWDAAINAWSLGDTTAGLQAAREYLEVERACSRADTCLRVEPPWAGTALVAAGLFQVGDVREAMHLREQAIEAARQVDPRQEPFDRLLSMVFLDDLLLDTSVEAAQRLLVARQRAPERSAPLACLIGIQAWRARARGDWEGARDLLAHGRPLAGLTGASGAQLGMGALAVELAALTGRDDDLRREHDLVRAQAQRAGDRRRLATLDRALGLRALADGRFEESLISLTAAADVPFLGRGLRDAVIPARLDLVEVHARMAEPDAARDRAATVLPVLADIGDAAARALELRVRALTTADAEAGYRAALEAHAEAHDPFEEARTALLLGEHLRRDRQPAAARIPLLAAARAFDALDARPWLVRTQRELHAAGGRPSSVGDLDCLTAQERSVAEAAASGLSTREVAERLFLSPRTVEYHLGSVYRKLGVHGRAALARRLEPSEIA